MVSVSYAHYFPIRVVADAQAMTETGRDTIIQFTSNVNLDSPERRAFWMVVSC